MHYRGAAIIPPSLPIRHHYHHAAVARASPITLIAHARTHSLTRRPNEEQRIIILYSVKNAENPRVSLLYTRTHGTYTRFRLIILLIFYLFLLIYCYYFFKYYNNIITVHRYAAEAVSHARTGAALPHVRFVVVVTSVVTRCIRAPSNPPPTARWERLIAASTPTPLPQYISRTTQTRDDESSATPHTRRSNGRS